MNILFLTEMWPYPSTDGGKLRAHHFLAGVSEVHNVRVAGFSNSPVPNSPYAGVTYDVVSPLPMSRLYRAAALLMATPVYPLTFRTARIRKLIHEALKGGIDLVHIQGFGMLSYLADIPAGVPIVADFVDCFSRFYSRLAAIQTSRLKRTLYRLETRKTARFERTAASKASAVICCSSDDASLIAGAAKKPVTVVRNGVADAPDYSGSTNVNKILFIGRLDLDATRDAVKYFARDIFPLVRRECPDAVFEIVGGGKPPPMPDMHHITLRGYVENLEDAYRSATLAIAPLRAGAGLKNKVLEAMARGIPVVTTSIGAEGIGARSGKHFLVADKPEEFAAHLVAILRNRELAVRLGVAARDHIRANFCWDASVRQLLEVYERVFAGQGR